ncbi:Transcription factor Iwr1 [Plasmopara halstedii]|uniref:Probable RNA polymerase II nuclear localization protein SLC7A6OS n=1 Tax=Plasmopara halstedii TaxID=4781 RepID=A0A0P1ASE5_PLAHL|nr:Transcription factor Iwr1 [Plasmopara halstedii]CEG44949.1 Transcription factor Iwr1 [Plasmopara halstedii]|eukprot:XP_024581318.1 Transcription factor Iwr1 [Plasmopara halstedii]
MGDNASQSTGSSVATKASHSLTVKLDEQKKPSFVFLSLKRKRTDEPMNCLVVQSEPDSKRYKTDLLEAFAQLSTGKKRFVFKHIDTMEESVASGHAKWTQRLKRKARTLKEEHANMMAKKHQISVFQKEFGASKQTEKRVKQQQCRSKARRNENVFQSRGLNAFVEIKETQKIELGGIRLVDLQMSSDSNPNIEVGVEKNGTKSNADLVTINGVTLKPTRVLNPYERELDEAIWAAFRTNDFAPFFRIYHAQQSEQRAIPTTFQRPVDGSTILMAAALHGRNDVIEVLLRSGNLSILQQDWEGATAAMFAERGGHLNVATALRACEEAEREKDYVYDVYCVDLEATEKQDPLQDSSTDLADISKQIGVNSAPIVNVSSEVHHWLSRDTPSDEVEEYVLESDLDSSEDDGLSEDSNGEDNAANDYPDEELSDESDESLADSDDLDEIRARRRWQPNDDDDSEPDNFEFQ